MPRRFTALTEAVTLPPAPTLPLTVPPGEPRLWLKPVDPSPPE